MEGSTITTPFSFWSTTARSVSAFDAACILVALWAFVKVFSAVRWRMNTTQLRGPPRTSVIYGVSDDLLSSTDAATIYERWAEEYGVVYVIPAVLGQTRIVLCDPKAIAHFYARETWTYVLTPLSLAFIEGLVSRRIFLISTFSYIISPVRLEEGYCGLRVKATEGGVQFLSSCQRQIH
jgi:hypothetical protein